MTMKILTRVCALMLVATLAACDGSSSNRSLSSGGTPFAGENMPAPDVTLTALNGTAVRLAELKGKVVLLNFWATWCPPCREEIPSMMALNRTMAGKPFQMLAVSMDEGGKGAVEAYFRASGNRLPAYTDQDGKAATAYGVTGFPETFIIDRNGIIIKKVVGPLDWSDPQTLAFLEGLMK